MATFFRINLDPKRDGRAWADLNWDTYGFDFDTEKTGYGVVIAWPLEDGEDGETELREALDEDEIDYDTFEVEDVEAFFGA